MLVRLLLAMVVIAGAVWLAVQAGRGRVRPTSCCSTPAEQDVRLR